MSATGHLDLGRLLDYYLSDAAVEETDTVEEHLFACAACAAQLEAIHQAADAVVTLVRQGEVSGGATTAVANRMARDGLNVRHYTVAPGETLACSVRAGDDFLFGRLVLPAGQFDRLDMRVLDSGGHELMRVADIAVDALSRHAMIFIPARPILSEASAVTLYTLVVPEVRGDREIARYFMDHVSPQDD